MTGGAATPTTGTRMVSGTRTCTASTSALALRGTPRFVRTVTCTAQTVTSTTGTTMPARAAIGTATGPRALARARFGLVTRPDSDGTPPEGQMRRPIMIMAFGTMLAWRLAAAPALAVDR